MSTDKSLSWPARSLLLKDILFFSTYWKSDTDPSPLVVYIGASSAGPTYLNLLCQLFPSFVFQVYEVARAEVLNPWVDDANITYFTESLTAENAPDQAITFLISPALDVDSLIESLKPKNAVLLATGGRRLAGTLYWPIWTEKNNTQTILVPVRNASDEFYCETPHLEKYLATCQEHQGLRDSSTYTNPYAYDDELVDDFDSAFEGKILSMYYETVHGIVRVADVIGLSQRISEELDSSKDPLRLKNLRSNNKVLPLVRQLETALLERDFSAIQDLLSSDELQIDNSRFRWPVNTLFYRDRMHNDSGLLMRAAVGSGCYGIVKLLLLEEAIDHGAMDNIALQDAILSGKKDIVELLAAAKTISCPRIYNTAPTGWTAYEIFRQGLDIFEAKHLKKYGSESKELVTDPVFVEFYKSEELPVSEVVRNTRFHQALLATYQKTQKEIYYKMLCECSSMKERRFKDRW